MAAKKETKPTTQSAQVIEEPKAKVYRFTSENEYLTVAAVGIQFIGGKAETDNLAVAKVLATLDGVKLVEE